MILPLNLMLSISIFASGYCHPRDTESGYFSQYSQPPTDGTIAYHQDVSGLLPQDMTHYMGVVAVKDCSLVGNDAWIWITDQRATTGYTYRWLPVKVFDCSGHAATTKWMNQNSIIGELGYYLVNRLGLYGKGAISGEIAFANPATAGLVCLPN